MKKKKKALGKGYVSLDEPMDNSIHSLMNKWHTYFGWNTEWNAERNTVKNTPYNKLVKVIRQ